MTAPRLALSDICKRFDGFPALDGAGLSVAAGEVHALLGENGAGKSSLMNIAAGLYTPDSGHMALDGVTAALRGPADARARGIGMVHQHFRLVRPFTVAENLVLALGSKAAMRGALALAADRLGFTLDPDRRVDSLSVAEQQQVEIVKAMAGGARLLILDEPTAVLTDAEAERLLSTVRGIAATGTAVVLVTHKLPDVRRFADKVTILRAGRTVGIVDPRATSDDDLTRLTVGERAALPPREARAPGRRRLELIGLRCLRPDGRPAVDGADLHVGAGEIYGLAGVSGNGQSELAEAIAGVRRPAAGVIQFEDAGADVTALTPGARRRLGLACIPADRYAHALAGDLSIAENFAVGRIDRGDYGPWGWVDRAAIRRATAQAIAEHDVQGVRSLGQKAALLSGGNAQKAVIAREFAGNQTIILAHSPSRGLDLKATAAVHARLTEARAAGAAVLLISEDLDEVLSLADRIGVMSRGRIVAEFACPADRQAIGRAMVGHG